MINVHNSVALLMRKLQISTHSPRKDKRQSSLAIYSSCVGRQFILQWHIDALLTDKKRLTVTLSRHGNQKSALKRHTKTRQGGQCWPIKYLWVFIFELAPCHHSGALNFEVPPKLSENLCIPDLRFSRWHCILGYGQSLPDYTASSPIRPHYSIHQSFLNIVEPGYNDIGLYDTSSIASDILRYQLISHC